MEHPPKCVSTVRDHWADLMEKRWARAAVYAVVIAAIAIFLIADTAGERHRLISAGGMIFLVLVGAIFSKHPRYGNGQTPDVYVAIVLYKRTITGTSIGVLSSGASPCSSSWASSSSGVSKGITV